MGTVSLTHEQMIFRDSIGQKAVVHREDMNQQNSQLVTTLISECGLKIQDLDPSLQHYKYKGGAAVHIFANELMNSLVIASHVQPLLLYRCPEDLAARSFDDLLRKMKQAYGKTQSKLRSGF